MLQIVFGILIAYAVITYPALLLVLLLAAAFVGAINLCINLLLGRY